MPRGSRTTLFLASILVCASATPASDATACRVDGPRLPAAHPGEHLIASLPTEYANELRSQGQIFPPDEAIPQLACPGMVHVIVILDASPEDAMRLLAQTHRQAEYLRNLHQVQELMRSEAESVVQHDLKILFKKLSYQLHYHSDPERHRIWWGLEPSFENDLRDVRGYWEFLPLDDGRTLALYGSVVDVGPVVPRRMQSALTRKSLDESMREIQKWVRNQRSESQ